MDYEKMYKEALERVRRLHDRMQVLSSTDALVASSELEFIFPELAENEDERIRKLLVWQVYRNIEDETNDLAQSVYDGIKGHDPDIEESIEDWKRCLAWLEKQKKPENTSASTMAPSCWEVEQKEQKPDWSEEDEEIIKTIISVLERSSQVVTYEQRGGSLSASVGCSDKYEEEIAWLKSLRPSWKPSEEQIEALNKARRFIPYNCDILESLYEQLKKL